MIKKLGEEIREFSEAGAPDELADVIEVIEALKTLREYSDVETIRQQKKADKGGFDKRYIVKGEK